MGQPATILCPIGHTNTTPATSSAYATVNRPDGTLGQYLYNGVVCATSGCPYTTGGTYGSFNIAVSNSPPPPTAAAGAGLGINPPSIVVGGASTSYIGLVGFGTGILTATGVLMTVTFSIALPQAPRAVLLSATSAATSALNGFVTGASTTGFTINAANSPTDGQGNSVYGYNYFVY